MDYVFLYVQSMIADYSLYYSLCSCRKLTVCASPKS